MLPKQTIQGRCNGYVFGIVAGKSAKSRRMIAPETFARQALDNRQAIFERIEWGEFFRQMEVGERGINKRPETSRAVAELLSVVRIEVVIFEAAGDKIELVDPG